MLEAVVAVYSDWGIGAEGTQPVTLRSDRRHFRELTRGAAVIVGRRTLADFPGGAPLPGRTNLVLSRGAADIPGAVLVRSPEEALAEAAKQGRCFVIGGAQVYRALFPHIDRVYVTKLDINPHSDVFFPDLDADPAFTVAAESERMEENGVGYRFLTYVRRPAQEE